MKSIKYIVALFLPLLVGCIKPDTGVDSENTGKYIFFSQGVETKVPLTESVGAMGQFGVVGYKYDATGSWNTYKNSNPLPNVFFSEADEIVPVETLICNEDNLTASYTPLQGWSNTRKYAFFAYYPLASNVVLVNTDGSAYTGGVPAIKYTLDPDDLQASMADVMVAPAHTDKYWYSASQNNVTDGDIKFSFQHCLSCLGLKIKNSSAGSIELNSVTVTVSGISHQDIVISLDGPERIYGSAMSGEKVCDLTLLDSEKEVTADGIELQDKLILIPQSEDLSVVVSIEYTRSAPGYVSYTDTFTSGIVTTTLTANRKHIICLNFTDVTVEVYGIANAGWTEVPRVDSTFN